MQYVCMVYRLPSNLNMENHLSSSKNRDLNVLYVSTYLYLHFKKVGGRQYNAQVDPPTLILSNYTLRKEKKPLLLFTYFIYVCSTLSTSHLYELVMMRGQLWPFEPLFVCQALSPSPRRMSIGKPTLSPRQEICS